MDDTTQFIRDLVVLAKAAGVEPFDAGPYSTGPDTLWVVCWEGSDYELGILVCATQERAERELDELLHGGVAQGDVFIEEHSILP